MRVAPRYAGRARLIRRARRYRHRVKRGVTADTSGIAVVSACSGVAVVSACSGVAVVSARGPHVLASALCHRKVSRRRQRRRQVPAPAAAGHRGRRALSVRGPTAGWAGDTAAAMLVLSAEFDDDGTADTVARAVGRVRLDQASRFALRSRAAQRAHASSARRADSSRADSDEHVRPFARCRLRIARCRLLRIARRRLLCDTLNGLGCHAAGCACPRAVRMCARGGGTRAALGGGRRPQFGDGARDGVAGVARHSRTRGVLGAAVLGAELGVHRRCSAAKVMAGSS